MSSALFVAVLLVTLDSLASGNGDPTCWGGGFTFEICCDLRHGPQGNPGCWDAEHTFQRCCKTPEKAQGGMPPSPIPPPIAKPAIATSPKQEESMEELFRSVWKSMEDQFRLVWESFGIDGEPIPLEYVLAVGIGVISVIFMLSSATREADKEDVPERVVIAGAIGEHSKKIDGLYVLDSERFGDRPIWRSDQDEDIWLLCFPGNSWWSIVSTEVKTQFEKGGYARSQEGYEIPPSALFARSQDGCELPTLAVNWSMWENSKFEASKLSVQRLSDQKKEPCVDGAEHPTEEKKKKDVKKKKGQKAPEGSVFI